MKKLIISLVTILIFISSGYSQKHFVNLDAGYSSLATSFAQGYFIHADYTSRFLGLFRIGIGLSSNSFMLQENGFLSHDDNLDLDGKLGLSIKLLGFRIEGGIGTFGRYWNRSYATDNNTNRSFYVNGQSIILTPGQLATFNYFTFGGFSYASLGFDINDRLGIKGYIQYKKEANGDDILNLGAGLYFMVNKKCN